MAKGRTLLMYVSDWQGDMKLGGCSLAARGLWFEMLCIMQDADPFGHLSVNRSVIPHDELARLVKCSPAELETLLSELERRGIFSRTEEGVIYSRRMLRDQARRERNAHNGRLGGNPKLTASDKPSDNRKGKSRLTGSVNPNTVQVQVQEKEFERERAKPEAKVIPMPFISEPFALAFAAFDVMRKKKGKPMTEHARELLLKKCFDMGEAAAITALNNSTLNSWSDIYPPKHDQGQHVNTLKTADPNRRIPNSL